MWEERGESEGVVARAGSTFVTVQTYEAQTLAGGCIETQNRLYKFTEGSVFADDGTEFVT